MKKTLLLSVVASTIIMAGGDIAPVEPIVVPVVETGWKFDGNMVAYYQTVDSATNDLFSTASASSNFGIQLRAVNDDLFWGLGAGFEVTGMSSSSLIADGAIQTAGFYNNGTVNGNTFNNIGGALTQAYLTYSIDAIDTSLKAGRQTLPKSLSPFAFSEQWQPVQNTFDAALVVNSSIPDTTLVYAFVDKMNQSTGNLGSFATLNPAATGGSNGVHMVTAQNKSIEGLTLTGSFYYGQEMNKATNDTMIAWGDAKFTYDGYSIGLQGGSVMDDDFVNNTVAYGAKIGAKFNLFDTDFASCVAFSSVDNGDSGVFNVGGVKTPLYTQMVLNQTVIFKDVDYVMAKAGADVLGGHFGVAFGYAIEDRKTGNNSPFELDVTYSTQVTDNTKLFAAYVMADPDVTGVDATNAVRVWARYNFK
jgi:hypothetical protein